MAMHPTSGDIEDSGTVTCWEESGLFGEGAVHTILGGKHVKRGVCAHVGTYQAFLSLYSPSFFFLKEKKDIYLKTLKYAEKLTNSWQNNSEEEISAALTETQEQFKSSDMNRRFE